MRTLLLGLALLILGGCANLAVQVDVLAPEQIDHVIEQAQLRREYSAALQDRGGPSRDEVGQYLEERLLPVLRQIAQKYRSEAQAAANPSAQSVLRTLANDLEGTTVDEYLRTEYIQDWMQRFDRDLRMQNQSILAAAAETPPTEDQPFTGALARALLARLATERRYWAEFDQRLSEEIAQNATSGASSSQKAEVETAIALALPGGPGLEASPYAYAVAKAPESVWATRFNQAVGAGLFGNLDVAIKLQRTASFTVKGLTFDPRKVAEVAAKVTTQSVLLAAQIAGVPVGLGGMPNLAGGANVGFAEPSDRVAKLTTKVEGRTARLQDRDQALRDIASSIVAEKANLAAGGPAAEQSRNGLARIYQANAPRLDLSGLQ